MNKVFLILSFCLFLSHSRAQMPETSIYYIKYIMEGDNLKTTEIKEISNGNGYNNQPSFSPDCKIIYYTSNISDSLQTDLYAYDLSKQNYRKISSSILSEYSPMIQPGLIFGLSHVRVEEDKKQQLRVYSHDYSSTTNLVPCSDSVGYYVWSDSSRLGLIILNNGLEFHTYKLGDSFTKMISKNAGRFINYDKKYKNYLFLSRDTISNSINYFNINKGEIQYKIPAMSGCEDYAIDLNSDIYGSLDGKLFRFKNTKWDQVADLSKQIGSFYRMAFCNCGEHLCVVSYKGKRP